MTDCHPTPETELDCEVPTCACGHLTLRIGRTSIELSAEEFAQLQRVLSAAALRCNLAAIALSTAPGDRMH